LNELVYLLDKCRFKKWLSVRTQFLAEGCFFVLNTKFFNRFNPIEAFKQIDLGGILAVAINLEDIFYALTGSGFF